MGLLVGTWRVEWELFIKRLAFPIHEVSGWGWESQQGSRM